jgi:hypothetical protein
MDNLINPPGIDIDLLGQSILADPLWLKIFVQENSAWMDWRQFSGVHNISSATKIRDLNVETMTIQLPEANPPLIVYANAELTFVAAFQFFQPIPRRDAKILEGLCSV